MQEGEGCGPHPVSEFSPVLIGVLRLTLVLATHLTPPGAWDRSEMQKAADIFELFSKVVLIFCIMLG